MPFIQFRWQDLIDILVVAFVIYRALLFFVDTRAVQLVRGLVILVAFGVAARILELKILSLELGRMMSAILIAIPILFQPELRSMLEELGRGRLWGTQKTENDAEVMADIVTRTLLYLADKRIGAILVFQRGTGLKDVWHSGVPLKAQLTHELLVSIFWPNNPLHDGATILDTNHIIAAACYLPLTDKHDISRWYGTRHRAAIGVTEISDAVAVVVSEEQGKVTLAVGGRLSRPLNEEQIHRFALRYFEAKDTQKGLMARLMEEVKTKQPKGGGKA